MSDESEHHSAELQDIIWGVAQLRRWSRLSVVLIVAACLGVFVAILFADSFGRQVASPGAEQRRAEQAAAELRRENARLQRENDELKRVAGLESRQWRPGASVAVLPDAGTTAPDAATVDAHAQAQAQLCAEFEVGRDWQKLYDCAKMLGEIAVKDPSMAARADEFKAESIKETAASLAASKLRDALTAGNLREAQKQFKVIGENSLYFSTSSEAFRAAEAKAIDENRRKADALVGKNDCAAVKRLQLQVNATSTAVVSAAVAGVAARCVERTAPAAAPSGTDSGHAAAGSGADLPINPGGAAPAKGPPCDTMNVDDLMSQAANQYAAGFSRPALQVVTKALQCKQDVRMYRFAATYACAARDAVSAKAYFAKIPPQFQPAIVQRCDLEGIKLQAP